MRGDCRKSPSRLSAQAREYAAETSLHGLKYVGEVKRTIPERLLWFILFLGSFILCLNLVYPIYEKYRDHPTITSIATTNYAIWNIHFPAVTVCSNNRVVASKFRLAIRRPP